MVARWLTVNILTIFLIFLWSFYQGYDSSTIFFGKAFAQAAFILFLINLNMYFVFLLIRKSRVRSVKIKLAKVSKRMMKYHISIALTGLLLIISHAGIMLYVKHDHLWTTKQISGVLSAGVLIILLFSGLLRRQKATGRRRRFHYKTAFIFFGLILLHVFI